MRLRCASTFLDGACDIHGVDSQQRPQMGTGHLPVTCEIGTTKGRRAVNVGWEGSTVGEGLGDFNAHRMKEHFLPLSLAEWHY